MNRNQINKIAENCNFPGKCKNVEITETHISWVIMAEDFAYKIKKPVKLSFLDFSTLEKRNYFCEKELTLNRRLEPEMYINILPVTSDLKIMQSETDSEVIDYALKMKRMDNRREMSRLLAKDEVTSNHIDKLAKKIALFHKNARVIKNAFQTLKFHEDFADIANHYDFISDEIGEEYKEKISLCIENSFNYLNKIRNFSNERVISGFQRDCHGDLNAHNIFLCDDNPVIFDCIEFSDELRQIDVLNEIAFLCVDLDFYGKTSLSELFYKKYITYFETTETAETNGLFEYYKSYRANIRAKVCLISAGKKNEKDSEFSELITDAQKYISLMADYMNL